MSDDPRVIDAELGEPRPGDAAAPQALVPLTQEPPTVLPVIVLDDLVPFPGVVVPILLDTPGRRDAVLHARSNNGFFALINRRPSEGEEGRDLIGEHLGGGDVAASASIAGAMLGLDANGVRESDPTGLGASDAQPVPLDDEDDKGDGSNRPVPSDDVRSEPVTLGELSAVGIAARIIRVFQLPDQRMSALVELVRRVQPIELLRTDPFVVARVLYPAEVVSDETHFEATHRQVRIHLHEFLEAHPSIPNEMRQAARAIPAPGILADFVAQHLSRGTKERLAFLVELDLTARMRKALEVTLRELDLLNVGNKITDEIREKVEKHQRDFFLREQLKAIRVELGEEKDPGALAIEELEKRLDAAGLPEHARTRADDELQRLHLLPTESPEHHVVRSYVDWIASLPWSQTTEDARDIVAARRILDEDHYGLEEVKDRIIEFLAVRQLNPDHLGTLICFAGPPGVGKTSLGKSIARALGRKFYRFSVGGMRDEAEIKGHRRTYVGAMPGRVLQALKYVGTANPLIMLDEIDKMGSDWRGDPSSAMLEVLDPAQNATFLDHYLDLTFDLSRVMFIATANVKAEIPAPLLDRLETIDLPGYIPEEKVEIAQRHLLGRQRSLHGLTTKQFKLGRTATRRIVRGYTHEAGVRELDRLIGKLCRKRATAVVEGADYDAVIKPEHLTDLLGPPKIHYDHLSRRNKPGVAVGLAWTAAGGEVLFIEAVRMRGKGLLKVTGQLGDVMSESASIALSYVRDHAEALGIPHEVFRSWDIHIHFPAGAVKKDGPSAGITITSALISLLSDEPLVPWLAMTGEMTLRGEVLPVGGIREKVVAARRAGVKKIILPARNRADVTEIPDTVRAQLEFVFASSYDDVKSHAFAASTGRGTKGKGQVKRPALSVVTTKGQTKGQKRPRKSSKKSNG